MECVNARVVAMVASNERVTRPTPPRGTPELTGVQPAYFRETGAVSLRRYARPSLGGRHAVIGPALIEDDWSTTIVYPGQHCRATPAGDLVIEARA